MHDNQINQHIGYGIYIRISSFVDARLVYQENYVQLIKFFQYINVNALSIWDARNVEALKKANLEIRRLFTNYLSSAFSLVDYARAFMKQYENTDFKAEYDEKVKTTFDENNLAKFIQKLRNYVIHCGFPSTEKKVCYGGEGISNNIYFNANELLQWDGWNKQAKEYIDELGEKINPIYVAIEYNKLVENFYDWFHAKLLSIHKQELEQFYTLCKQSNVNLNYINL